MRICPQCGAETTALTCRNDGFGTVDAARYRRFDPTQLLGTLFQDRYRIDAVLGSGGMGSVYRATQVRVGRQVALKVINAELAYDLAVVARFQREGRAIASLIHPSIVQVYDFGQTEDGQLFMAMELVNGKTLADLVREEAPLDPSRVVHVGAQIFDALAEAHEHGVVHRDLKPENVFVTETGRRHDVVKILDFGVAKIVNEPKSESMVTARGAILGSPKYMAPEQARGKGVTGHADLYAAGGILYELLTGHAVFNEPSPADYLVAHSVKMPTPPSVNGRELRGPLVDLIMKCLEKKPWNRPDGASRALETLEACRLLPLVQSGDDAPVLDRELSGGPEGTPRRLVRPNTAPEGMERPPALPAEARNGGTSAASPARTDAPPLALVTPVRAHELTTPAPQALRPPQPPAANDDDDRRPRVSAPGLVRVADRRDVPTDPKLPPVQSVDTRRLGSREAMAMAAAGLGDGRLMGAAGPQVEETQEGVAVAITTPESAVTDGGLKVVGVARRRDRQRGGALWLAAAAALVVLGGIVVLAANGFFLADRNGVGAGRTAGAQREAVSDPVETSSVGPAAPGPSALAAVAGAGEPGASGDAVGPVAGTAAVEPEGSVAAAAASAGAAGAGTAVAASGDRVAEAPPGANGVSEAATTAAGAIEAHTVATSVTHTGREGVLPAAGSATRDAAAGTTETPPRPRTAATGAANAATQRDPSGAVVKAPAAAGGRDPVRRTTPPLTTARIAKDPLADLEDPDFPDKKDEPGQLRRVLVDSVPSGADIRMGSLPLGKTPVRVEWKDFGQPVVVSISREGYFPYHATLSPAQASLTAKLKPVTMEAPPSTGP